MLSIENDVLHLEADENDGMTVVSLKYRGTETIEADPERKARGVTYGIPLLFPTPNRVRNGSYDFGGRRIKGEMHGTLRHARFSVVEKSEEKITAEVSFSSLGEIFPYEGKFMLCLSISGHSVIWEFLISNEGDESCAFGLALHPFFIKREGMSFSSTLEYRMEADEGLLPTGEFEATDYGRTRDVSEMDTDTVFFSANAITSTLSSPLYEIEIEGSADFDHVVVFTSPDRSFICVEPQTCSTDAHNIYARGLKKESGLIVVPGKSSHSLAVRMNFR